MFSINSGSFHSTDRVQMSIFYSQRSISSVKITKIKLFFNVMENDYAGLPSATVQTNIFKVLRISFNFFYFVLNIKLVFFVALHKIKIAWLMSMRDLFNVFFLFISSLAWDFVTFHSRFFVDSFLNSFFSF